MAKALSFRCSISKLINAPLPFVYAWCTDFREDDPKITGQKRRVSIYERTKHRFIMSVRYKTGRRVMNAARIVSLLPPDAWHLDWIGDEGDETGDYRLTRLGRLRTRLNITFRVRTKTSTAPTRLQWVRDVNALWDKYVAALDRDYKKKHKVYA